MRIKSKLSPSGRPKLDQSSKEIKFMSYKELRDKVSKNFLWPKAETTRLLNCLFHEILSSIKDGYAVRVPYFGTFYTRKRLIRSPGQRDPQTGYLVNEERGSRVYPRTAIYFTPDMYAKHVVSEREEFKESDLTYRNNYGTTFYWDKTFDTFNRRKEMLQDNPYTSFKTWAGHKNFYSSRDVDNVSLSN